MLSMGRSLWHSFLSHFSRSHLAVATTHGRFITFRLSTLEVGMKPDVQGLLQSQGVARTGHFVRQPVAATQKITLDSGKIRRPTRRRPIKVNDGIKTMDESLLRSLMFKEKCKVTLLNSVLQVGLVIKLRSPCNLLAVDKCRKL